MPYDVGNATLFVCGAGTIWSFDGGCVDCAPGTVSLASSTACGILRARRPKQLRSVEDRQLADGKVCQLECRTGVGELREDLTIPELGLHFDIVIGLDEIGDNNYPALDLGDDGRVKTALHEKAFVAWLAAAQRVAFGTLTRLAAEKRTHHSPAVVTPLAVSAGGGIFLEEDDRLPCGADRNGRHWTRARAAWARPPPRARAPRGPSRSRHRPAATIARPGPGLAAAAAARRTAQRAAAGTTARVRIL